MTAHADAGGGEEKPDLVPLPVLASQLDLRQALAKVTSKSGMAGADGVSCKRYAAQGDSVLRGAVSRLSRNGYRPDPLRLAEMQKKSGGSPRLLLIPTVADRVLQTAMASWLGNRWNAKFDRASFAYRPGLGVSDALKYIAELRDSGHRWVLDADLQTFFDSIPQSQLFARLRENLGPAAGAVGWIEQWTSAVVWDGAQLGRTTSGVPQGSPLSPLLANFYLDSFDRTLRSRKIPFVRYADDFLVLARTPFDLAGMRSVVESTLTGLGLTLNAAKTRVTCFDEGFRFLGATLKQREIFLPFGKVKAAKAPSYVAPVMGQPLLRSFRAGHLTCTPGWKWVPFSTRAAPAPVTEPAASLWSLSGGDRSPALEALRRMK